MIGEQPRLFDTQNEPVVPAIVSADYAAQISANAPSDPYTEATAREQETLAIRDEDLAREQTGRTSEVSEVTTDDTFDASVAASARSIVERSTDRPIELPGARGRVRPTNSPHLPTPAEAQRGLSKAEIDRRNDDIKAHTAEIRKQLREQRG